MTLEVIDDKIPVEEVETVRPRLSFETVTFSDGTVLRLGEDDVVVFVGPNNAGKSATLRELEAWVARSLPKACRNLSLIIIANSSSINSM